MATMHRTLFLYSALLFFSAVPSLALPSRPPGLSEEKLRIAFGSCIENPESPIWESILTTNPDLFVFLGDNVYIPKEKLGEEQWLRAAYKRLFDVPSFKRLIRTTPYEAIWDDHDFGPNNSDSSYQHAALSRQLFVEAWGERSRPRGLEESVASKAILPNVTILLTDNRTYRIGPNRQKDKPTMFGVRQLEWLSDAIRNATDPFLIIASGGQLLRPDASGETLGEYEEDQKILHDAFRSSNAKIIILSGDRHEAQIFRESFGQNTVFEITSSPLSGRVRTPVRDPVGLSQLGLYRGGSNFGMVTLSHSPEKRVSIEIFDQWGNRTLGYFEPVLEGGRPR
jgi:alkaline phosphatase D